jgi:cell division protein FtsI (penicillin-binding protein 3)
MTSDRQDRPRTTPARGAGHHRVSGRPAPAARVPSRSNGTRPVAATRSPVRAARRRPMPRRKIVQLADPGTRLRASLFAVAFLLSLFAGRLLQLQGVDASLYATVADSERRTTQAIQASRGEILDRNGVALAQTIDAVNVFADQTVINNPELTATLLAPYLDETASDLTERLTGTRQFVYLAKDLDPETWKKIENLQLAGIHDEVVHRRSYPGDTLAANVLGFVNDEGVGSAGVEQAFNSILTGTDGQITYVTDGGGRRIPTVESAETAAVPGQDVKLTIDRDLQWVAQQQITAQVEKAGAQSGTVVVMDVQTQQILALATAPTYNPNNVKGTDPNILGDRAIADFYEPGSIEKAVTASALIEEGLVTPQTVFTVPDRIVIDGEDYHDHDSHPTGQWTFTNIIAESSNVGTIEAADPMPAETLDRYLRSFGFGQLPGLGLPGESAGLIHSPDSKDYHESTRHTMAFGQGMSVTSVQMASAYATIANGGVRVSPSIVAGTVGTDGSFSPVPPPTQTRVISESTAKQVSEMLEMVVTDGTGKPGRIDGYRVAGKTGTSQAYNPACGCYSGFTASFAGFAPADAPRVVVYVIVQQPTNGHFGSTLGGPVFHEVMKYALQKLEIPPTGTTPPDLPLFG